MDFRRFSGRPQASFSLCKDFAEAKVTVKIDGDERQYTIVSFNEADPLAGKISNESPIGTAFLNKKIGDIVSVETPSGKMEYEILKIE